MCNRLNIRLLLVISCFQWFKDTKMKANHNLKKKLVIRHSTIISVIFAGKPESQKRLKYSRPERKWKVKNGNLFQAIRHAGVLQPICIYGVPIYTL